MRCEILPCSYASVDASHSKKYTWNMTVRAILPGHSLTGPVWKDQTAKSCSSQSGPTARAGLTSLHSAQKAEQLAANQFEPLRTIINIITHRSESLKEREGPAERRAVCSLAHVMWLTVPLFEHSVGVYRNGGQAGTHDPSTCNNALRNACSFFSSFFNTVINSNPWDEHKRKEWHPHKSPAETVLLGLFVFFKARVHCLQA